MPEVSVVIPTRNRPDLLPRAISSVRAQRDVDEVIIILVDDSSDLPEHLALLKKLEQTTPSLRLIRHTRRRGAAAARNTGILGAETPFVAFLDDDDTWAPYKLQLQLDLMHELGEDCILVGCGLERTALAGTQRVFGWPQTAQPPWIDFNNFLRGFCAFLQSMIVRREAVLNVGLLREDLRVLEDFEWVLRLLRHHRGATLDEVLVYSPEQSAGLFQRYDLRAHALSEIIHAHAESLAAAPGTLAFAYYELAKAHARNNHRCAALAALYQSWRRQPAALRPYMAFLPILLGAAVVERIQNLGLGRQ